MDITQNRNLFPIKELSSDKMIEALNNLHDRVMGLETASPLANGLSPSDRAVLDHCANFFRMHITVAETLASKEAGVTDIDPLTGKERIIVERPQFAKAELPQTGS